MDITVQATPEEIAGLVLALQDRRGADGSASKVLEALQEKIGQADPNRQGVWHQTG